MKGLIRGKAKQIIISALLGAAIGYAIYFLRGVKTAPFLCIIGAVSFTWWRLQRAKVNTPNNPPTK